MPRRFSAPSKIRVPDTWRVNMSGAGVLGAYEDQTIPRTRPPGPAVEYYRVLDVWKRRDRKLKKGRSARAAGECIRSFTIEIAYSLTWRPGFRWARCSAFVIKVSAHAWDGSRRRLDRAAHFGSWQSCVCRPGIWRGRCRSSRSSRAKVLGANLISAMCASAVMMAAAHVLLYLGGTNYIRDLSGRVHPAFRYWPA